MKRAFRSVAFVLTAALVLTAIPLGLPQTGSAQVRPIYDMGASGLGQMLLRLQYAKSAMHTGAHPDDEDSGLMAYLARREAARATYLSLNRGEGGQNVIGEELFEGLGVIRTEELLQARRLDGGDQHFTRVMDYGFSKTIDEARRNWNEQQVLADMVRAIRIYKPLVVISRFSGTPADGHGHHQLAGYLTPLAFRAAGDPSKFPEHMREGIEPWQPLKLYRGQGFRPDAANPPTIVLNTGIYDPLIGRSYFEIAMEGRSQHKSQEMGVLELRGRQSSGMTLLESKAAKVENETSVFDGIDTSITGIAALTNNSEATFKQKLAELQATAAEALREYDAMAPEKIVPILARGYKQAYDAEWSTRKPDSKFFVRHKKEEFAEALRMAAGVVVDALADTEMLNPGASTNVGVRVFANDGSPVKVVKTSVAVPAGWAAASIAEPEQPPATGFRPRNENAMNAAFFKLTAAADARPTQPYWLETPRDKFTFDWSTAGTSQNMPFAEPLATAEAVLEIGGQEITVRREVEYRFADDIRGELRRPLTIVPAATIGLDSDLLIVSRRQQATKHRIVTTVTNNTPGELSGNASLDLPSGWTKTPQAVPFTLPRFGDKTAFTFEVTVPANTAVGSYKVGAIAEAGGKRFNESMQTIAYPHMQTHRIFKAANVTAHVLDLEIAQVKIGYIMGSGDKVPEAIRRLGLDVAMLGEKDLSTGDLSAYDIIMVGVRASQVRPDFVANNGRLLDFARNGGTLVVQYQQHEYIQNNMQPFPASMTGVTRGNQRIGNVRTTDENAKVNVLVPAHPIFNYPNKIGESDWANWVQERNLYAFSTWDAAYTPLLESTDEGDDPNKGAMLYAQLGKGHYLYTSYSWFRQLPAGTPGAYRIFANILSLPKAPK